MKTIMKYEAFDGTVFDTEEECCSHEKIHDFNGFYSKGLKVYDRSKRLIAPNELNVALPEFNYFSVPDKETAENFLEWMRYEGYETPEIKRTTSYPAQFFYDEDRDVWVNLKEAVHDLLSTYDVFDIDYIFGTVH